MNTKTVYRVYAEWFEVEGLTYVDYDNEHDAIDDWIRCVCLDMVYVKLERLDVML